MFRDNNLQSSLKQHVSLPAAVVAAAILFLAGCPRTTIVGVDSSESNNDAGELASPEGKPLLDAWDVLLINDSKLGHIHTVAAEKTQDGETTQTWRAESLLRVVRSGDVSEQSVSYSCVTDEKGRLISFKSVRNDAGNISLAIGKVKGGQLLIETEAAGQKRYAQTDWKAEYGGFFAFEQSLLNDPLKPGEKRTLTALLPIFNQLGEIEATALAKETTWLLDDRQELLKVEQITRIGGNEMKAVAWMNDRGEVLKVHFVDGNQTGFRTTKNKALDMESGKPYDLGLDTMVAINKPAKNPHEAAKAVYLATLKRVNPADVFPTGPGQSLQKVDDLHAEITLQRGGASFVDRPPEDADLNASSLIQCDDERVITLADKIKADAGDTSFQTAKALEQLVNASINEKNFNTGFASAAEVARTLSGDCTEHSVLLAAVCRAKKIPARVAVGLVYVPAKQAFAYHMWTEVWAADQWRSLDATLGKGGIGAGHLKLADSNLADTGALAAFLPVVKVLNQLELELKSVE